MSLEILIRGAGEIASAVAHLLVRGGCRVALQSSRPPIAIRRRMAFSDAFFGGAAELEGLLARRLDHPGAVAQSWACGEIPLLAMEFPTALAARPWAVLVDARMNKQQAPESQRGLAPLVVGMGPGCTAGLNVDVAVETSWDQLGRVVRRGSTLELAGEPRAVLGQARSRFRYAPVAGILRAEAAIGQRVRAGEVVARIGDTVVEAPFDGIVRGLTHDGVPVEQGNKIAEIDPRPGAVKLAGIDERPRRIAEAVAAIVLRPDA
ncbi:xanthine and CO dehydrogenase maturation factor [Paramagnetospirillum caucaseum]|uniref:Xanthine and CO dehydrogenase maturation factor n=1 Tax=Paramagnetospirillum caucaseum TaxID=1244869 RepID=M2Z6T7_9PROT|nr:xanthine and CO dehydrogenase maturation factor [Paramagnetospirillum caucaseum]EME70025.1 xanthine and CO dehydrogenase maturation factor [Paramagnetospirillum caucaseum]